MAVRKLTDDDVRHMRALHDERRRLVEKADQLTISRIADKFEVSYSTAYEAIFFATYRDVH